MADRERFGIERRQRICIKGVRHSSHLKVKVHGVGSDMHRV